jgi:2-polyprenyl-6-methoxyphenol hydroxylase-like FAD-dependent oxidoreductase
MTKVLIAGAGIAGPAAAVALHKAGIEAAVFEACPDAADWGSAFVTIPANGQDALHAIDAGQVLSSISFPISGLRFLAPGGTFLGEFPLGGQRPPSRTVTRAALSASLAAEAARRGIPVAYGKRLTAVDHVGQGVTASFADGTSADGDVLVGADGVYSCVRGLIDPCAPAPRYAGLTLAVGHADGLPGPDCEPGTATMIYGSRAYCVHIAAPDGRLWWSVRLPGPEPAPDELDAPAGHWRERIAAAFDADPTPAAGIIRATRGPVTVTVARDIPVLAAWRNGPVVLIGDAAHAASPFTTQGVSLALEDAVALARCLRDIPDIHGALAAYEHLRRDRVERVVQAGGSSGANPVPPSPGTRMEGPPSWLLDHHIDWAEKVYWPPEALPDLTEPGADQATAGQAP